MRFLILLPVLFGLTSCFSGPRPKPDILAPKCEVTPVQIRDMEAFNFQPAPGKIVVVRLIRINCPFCKADLKRIGGFFGDGTWKKENVHVFLIAYRKEGVEDRRTFDKFMREELPDFGIPMESVQAVYLDKDYYGLVKSRDKDDHLIFEGWKAVPFGMVFGKDGRLAYRGHFTSSPGSEDAHYKFIRELQSENCPIPPAGAKAP